MGIDSSDSSVIKGIKLWKTLLSLCFMVGGEGVMVFEGNEFGHPEWIEFPSQHNNDSFEKCRRLWNLADDASLRYQDLENFSKGLNSFISHHGSKLYENFPLLVDSSSTKATMKRGEFIIEVDFSQLDSEKPSFLVTSPSAHFVVN